MGIHQITVVVASERTINASAIALAVLLVGVADSSRALIAVSLYAGAAVALFLFRRTNAEVEELEQTWSGTPAMGAGADRALDGDAPAATLVPVDRLFALPGYGSLTERERNVCALLVQGRDRAFIAERLGLSEGTVKTHVQHVYQKLGVHSKQELISAARGEDGGR